MTITYKGEIPAGRQGRNSLGIRTYQRQFRLVTDSRSDGPYAIGSNASLPSIGSVHPEDSSAWCRELTVDNDEPYTGWIVTANYSSERELSETPTSDPAFITWDSEQFQKPAIQDKDGDAVVNSAGDFFDPPAMMDDSRRVVTVQKNLTTVPAWILDYQDAVNSDSFSVDGVTIAIGTAKMQRVSVGAEDIRNGTTFRQVTFTMHLQRDGWDMQILDAGFRRIDPGDSTKRIAISLDDGTEPTTPALLNGSGGLLSNPTPANAVFKTFSVYKTRTFSSLPLS
jgi:hypothetical protein